VVFGVIGVLGFTLGGIANAAVARLLRLPDGAERPEYTDVAAPEHSNAGAADHDAVAEAEPRSPAAGGTHARPPSKKSYADAILRRNIFDSTAVYNPDAAAANGNGECKSDSSVKLLATIVADPPEYSSALISVGASRDTKATGFSIGDELGGEGRITLIEQQKVCLDGGSCLCMGSETARPTAAADDSGSSEGVTKEGDTKFTVDSSVVADAMNNFEQLAGQIRVVPHKDTSGQIDGYRLSAIRKGSLFDKLGIKNGDIVNGVNGQPLTSTEGALQTYQALKSERSFTFDVTRRNQKMTFEYEIR
jgi:general secretion pathway protein C